MSQSSQGNADNLFLPVTLKLLLNFLEFSHEDVVGTLLVPCPFNFLLTCQFIPLILFF